MLQLHYEAGSVWPKDTHPNTHMHRRWKWYLDTAGCSRSVFRALEDCDWWCSRLQGRGYLPGDRAMWQSMCVCVRERRRSRGMWGNVCIYLHWNLLQMSNVNSGLPVSWHTRFPARLSPERHQHEAACPSAQYSNSLQCAAIVSFYPINSIKESFFWLVV